MSMHNPSNLTELHQAIGARRIFRSTSRGIYSASVAVMGSVPADLSGYLAERVVKSATEYRVQYMTGGGRKRMPGHVVYYVAMNSGHVLGYAAANGDFVTDMTADGPASSLTKATRESIIRGFWRLSESLKADRSEVSRDGLHQAGYDDATDSGAEFVLVVRDSSEPRESARRTVYASRDEAFAARAEAMASGRFELSPVGVTSPRTLAHVERVQLGDVAPVVAAARGVAAVVRGMDIFEWSSLTCSEVDAFAHLLRTLGDDATADRIVANHATGDDEGDAHAEDVA